MLQSGDGTLEKSFARWSQANEEAQNASFDVAVFVDEEEAPITAAAITGSEVEAKIEAAQD